MGVLILRAWADGALPDGLRVRITSRLDLSSADDEVTMAFDRQAALAAIGEWLDRFVAG